METQWGTEIWTVIDRLQDQVGWRSLSSNPQRNPFIRGPPHRLFKVLHAVVQPVSHSKSRRKIPCPSCREKGKGITVTYTKSSVLNKVHLQKKLFNQSLTDAGEWNTFIQPTLATLPNPGRGKVKHAYFAVQRHNHTKRLRPNHSPFTNRTMIPSPPPQGNIPLLKAYSDQFLLSSTKWLTIKKTL